MGGLRPPLARSQLRRLAGTGIHGRLFRRSLPARVSGGRGSETRVEHLFLIIIVASIIGSRAFHVMFEELPYYMAHPEKIWALWEGGYTFYGAMIASLFAMYLYCLVYRLEFLEFADLVSPSTLLGLAIGRVGCFLAGCCWGKETTMPWGTVFTDPNAFTSLKGVPLHPTQLYEALSAFLLFMYLAFKSNERRYRGQIFFQALIGYAAFRFVIEFFRGDDYRGFVFNGVLSYSQLVSLTVLPFGLLGVMLFSQVRRPQH